MRGCLASLGQFYVSQKRWPEAFQSLNAAIAAAPHDVFYKHELAVAKTASGDVESGLALFTQLVGPDKAHYNVALLLRQEGKIEAAAQECRLVLSINPKFEPGEGHARHNSATARWPAIRGPRHAVQIDQWHRRLRPIRMPLAEARCKRDLPPARSCFQSASLRNKPGYLAASGETGTRGPASHEWRRNVRADVHAAPRLPWQPTGILAGCKRSLGTRVAVRAVRRVPDACC